MELDFRVYIIFTECDLPVGWIKSNPYGHISLEIHLSSYKIVGFMGLETASQTLDPSG
jgi:hypothetical protein